MGWGTGACSKRLIGGCDRTYDKKKVNPQQHDLLLYPLAYAHGIMTFVTMPALHNKVDLSAGTPGPMKYSS